MKNIESKRKAWSEEELSVLQLYYSSKGPEFCKDLLPNRTLESIKLKAQRSGILRDRFWTQEEISILETNYPTLGNYKCQELLPGRNYNSINQKASELQIKGDSRFKGNDVYDHELLELGSDMYRVDEYAGAQTPIKHECLYNHSTVISPADLLRRGGRCLNCSRKKGGFDPSKAAILYYVRIDKKYYKIGITNRTVRERFKQDDFSRIEILWEKSFENGSHARAIEDSVKEKFYHYKANIPDLLRSGGNTEVFKFDIMSL